MGDVAATLEAWRAKRVRMPLFPLLLQSTDAKTPPARAAAIAVAFVVLSSLFVGGSSSAILARFAAGI